MKPWQSLQRKIWKRRVQKKICRQAGTKKLRQGKQASRYRSLLPVRPASRIIFRPGMRRLGIRHPGICLGMRQLGIRHPGICLGMRQLGVLKQVAYLGIQQPGVRKQAIYLETQQGLLKQKFRLGIQQLEVLAWLRLGMRQPEFLEQVAQLAIRQPGVQKQAIYLETQQMGLLEQKFHQGIQQKGSQEQESHLEMQQLGVPLARLRLGMRQLGSLRQVAYLGIQLGSLVQGFRLAMQHPYLLLAPCLTMHLLRGKGLAEKSRLKIRHWKRTHSLHLLPMCQRKLAARMITRMKQKIPAASLSRLFSRKEETGFPFPVMQFR